MWFNFCLPRVRSNRRQSNSVRRHLPHRLEELESRTLLAATVMNLNDSGPGSLREAIVDANENPGPDVIDFDAGLTGEIKLTTGQLEIMDDLVLKGPHADRITVSGEGVSRVFAVMPARPAEDLFVPPTLDEIETAPTVIIQKLTVANGFTNNAIGFDLASGGAAGAGIYNVGGDVHLDRMHFENNRAEAAFLSSGGAAANEFGGILTVTHSHFENNVSQAFFLAAGGAISGDTVPVAGGGVSEPPVYVIDQTSFVGNVARTLGGHSELSVFSGIAVGGAVVNATGSLTVTESEFVDNRAEGGLGGVFNPLETTGGQAFGGAIISVDEGPFGPHDTHLDIRASTFLGNTATGGNGAAEGVAGGEAAGGAVSVSSLGNALSKASFSGNTFRNNVVVGGTGGQGAQGGAATGGGVAGLGGSILSLTGNFFINNTADGGAGSGANNGAGRGGGLGLGSIESGGFISPPTSGEVVYDTFVGNKAGLGGGVYSDGELKLENALLKWNTAHGADGIGGDGRGGGIFNDGILNVDRSIIAGNRAIGLGGSTGGNGQGGGIFNGSNGNARVTRSFILSNSAQPGSGADGADGLSQGGGIYNGSGGTLEADHLTELFAMFNSADEGDDFFGPIL